MAIFLLILLAKSKISDNLESSVLGSFQAVTPPWMPKYGKEKKYIFHSHIVEPYFSEKDQFYLTYRNREGGINSIFWSQ